MNFKKILEWWDKVPSWVKRYGTLVLFILLVPICLWSMGALYYSNLPWAWLRATLAWIFPILIIAALIIFPKRIRTILISYAVILLIFIWYLLIPASNAGPWRRGNQVIASATVNGNDITVHNVRNFDYRTENDYTEHYETRHYDLSKLKTMDMFLSYWDHKVAMAHMMLSFGFEGGKYLTVSMETRVQAGRSQDTLPGLFRQYGIICILGDERDLVRLRTDFRGELVYLYRFKMKPEGVRLVFLDILRRANELVEHPRFYNTISFNCLTSLIPSICVAHPKYRWDIRILANGFSDKLLWERKTIVGSDKLTFQELKNNAFIKQYLPRGYDVSKYSELIRKGLNAIPKH